MMTRYSMPSYRLSAVALCYSLVLGCSSSTPQSARPRLADLPGFDRSILASGPVASEQQLDALYQQILALQPSAQTRQKILYRLSQMHTSQLERQELPLAQEKAALQQLVLRYQLLLQDYPDDPNNELIRYQLARSYDLLGEQQACLQQLDLLLQDYPASVFASEAWFRKADIHYSRGDYANALQGYLAVQSSADATLTAHARYMAGWSYFKQQQFAQADEQFLQVLDHSYTEVLLTETEPPQQSLRDEVLRTLSLSLSYQQQGDSLQALLQRTNFKGNERPVAMVAQLYQALADFLGEKQLVSAQLRTYSLFIADYPYSVLAARMQRTVIEHYLSDADATQALSAQQDFLRWFGPGSAFWQQASGRELLEVQPWLLQYLDYFARAGYARALTLDSQSQQAAFAAVVPLWQQMLQILREPLLAHSEHNTAYSAADISYLLTESYAGAQQFEAALAGYTELAYAAVPQDASLFTPQDAAYKALLLGSRLAVQSAANAARWQQQQTDFVRYHSSHPAAQQVALQQLQQRYNEQDYAAVLADSRSVTDWPHAASSQSSLVLEAQFLHSQSQLALEQYAQAEQSINALLAQNVSAPRRELLSSQLASSIYQQAQQQGASAQAVQGHLQRLLTRLPDSAYHEAAAFEQITLLRSQADHLAAIPLLTTFIQRYGQTERAVSAEALLLDSYEQAGQWQQAAAQLSKLAAVDAAPEQQREALYLSAQYYQRAGATDKALDAWRSYANRYPEPHLLAQEARLQLVLLYQQQRDVARQNFWREKIASFEQQFAAQGNARSQQLAAEALLELGQHNSALFTGVRLAHPLAQSLKQKRQHMATAIKQFEQSMQFGVAGLVSAAQFQVAELYQHMAKAILDSDRPKGLDELALEEYELLLEEQAYPFEEQAIAIYQQNTRLTQQQLWDSWIERSFQRLSVLLPAKFDKTEAYSGVADAAY